MENRAQKLERQLRSIREKEEKKLIAKHYPKFKKLVGKFYKIRDNYSCPRKKSDYWYKYVKITEINPDDIYDVNTRTALCSYKGYSFNTDKYGVFTVVKDCNGYVHLLDEQITEEEFNTAWNKAMDSLNKL